MGDRSLHQHGKSVPCAFGLFDVPVFAISIAALVSLLMSLSALLRRVAQIPMVGMDDANIFLVYAKNFATGHGFVFNHGGERVEGFTSLLWILLIAPILRLAEQPEVLISWLCVVLYAVALSTVFMLFLSLTGKRIIPAISFFVFYLVIVLSLPNHLVWMFLSLMDSCLWSCLNLLLAVFLFHSLVAFRITKAHVTGISAIAFFLTLSRPESFFVLPVVITSWSVLGLRIGRLNKRIVAIPAGAALAGIIGLLAFRLTYFGFPLPNTYYAKISPDLLYNVKHGSIYLSKFLDRHPLIWIPLLYMFFNIARSIYGVVRGPQSLPVGVFGRGIVSLHLLSLLVLPVLVGGDHFSGFRMFQVVWLMALLPITLLLLDQIIDPTFPRRRKLIGIIVLTLLALAQATIPARNWPLLFIEKRVDCMADFELALLGRTSGEALNDFFPPTSRPSVGVIVSGGLAYAYSGQVVDLMGLSNVEMAHSNSDKKGLKNHAAFDPEVFWSQKPDIINPWALDSEKKHEEIVTYDHFFNALLKGLYDTPEFRENYTYVVIWRDEGSSPPVKMHVQNTFLDLIHREGTLNVHVVHLPTLPQRDP